MDTDTALARLGRWYGRWQMTIYIILCISSLFPASWHMLSTVFIAGIPEHRCILPEGHGNDSYPIVYNAKTNSTSEAQCEMYTNISIDNKTMDCPMGWEYYGDVGETIISDWDLVCGRDYLAETSQTIMTVGVMFGAMLFTWTADTFGRKPTFILTQLALVVVGTITVFATNYYYYVVMRFLTGALQQGMMLVGYVMACELFPAKYRTIGGMLIGNFWAIGMGLLALFAYLIRQWRYLQLLLSLPAIVAISFYWILPESIPWLVANEGHAEAERILRKAAATNRVSMPERILSIPEGSEQMLEKGKQSQSKQFSARMRRAFVRNERDKPSDMAETHYSLLDVLRHRRLCINALIMCLLWFVNSLVYYGLSLSTSALAGDRYINFFLSGLVEIPAYTICIFVLMQWGRRLPLVAFHILAGVSLVLTMFVPDAAPDGTNLVPLRITLSMIGKFGITGSFSIVYLYAPEIFPTTLRGQAIGIASVGGRLGGMLAPYSSLVARHVGWLPGILFGCLSIGVGLLALLLPETNNRPLPQTIEDIESWYPNKPARNRGARLQPVSTGVPVPV